MAKMNNESGKLIILFSLFTKHIKLIISFHYFPSSFSYILLVGSVYVCILIFLLIKSNKYNWKLI